MSTSREQAIVRAFVALSNDLADEYDIVDLLSGLASDCARLLGIASAGILLANADGSLHVVAASSERTHALEVYQLQRDDGPCVECFQNGAPVHVPDLADADHRYPHFAPAARELGFASVHAIPLRLRSRVLGAMGLFGDRVGTLDHDDLELVQALAHVASVAVVNEAAAADSAVVNAQLEQALRSRVVLEQAKGVLAHSGDLEMDVAFEVLRRYARQHGRRLADVAGDVTGRRLPSSTVLEFARSVAIVP